MISTILQKVGQSANGDLSENKYWQQLRILLQLRNLAKQFDRAMEEVSKFFKEEKDPFFQRGVKKGIEEGDHVNLSVTSGEKHLSRFMYTILAKFG